MELTETLPPLSKIEQEANRILAECEQTSVPIDVQRVAEYLKATVRQEELDDDISGALVISNDVPVIAVNKDHGTSRQRFTIAHECGHLVLHSKSQEVFIDRSAVFFRNNVASFGLDQKEVTANNFAAALLMPRDQLLNALQSIDESLTTTHIKKLANSFGVSEQAMSIRLARLDLIAFI